MMTIFNIEVGNDPYVKIFYALDILNYRYLYLRRILSTNKKKNVEETFDTLNYQNPLPEIFYAI